MKTPVLIAALATFVATAVAEPSITLEVTPEREAVQAGGKTILQVEVSAKPAPKKRTAPLNLAIVLDRSGSMRGAKIEKARQAAMLAVDMLGANDTFSLIVYDTTPEVLIPASKVGNKRKWKALIEAIEPGSATALYAGVETGAKQIRQYLDEEMVNRVVLLSDGLANNGPSSPAELAALGKSLRKDGISVSTVGLGDDYNEDLMTALAEASHANYYYVADVEKLPEVFEEELGAAQSVVAKKVKILIRLASGIEAAEVLGEEGMTFENGTLIIPIEDLSGTQTRRFLVSCRLPETAGDSVKLGSATLEYEDLALGSRQTTTAAAAVRIVEDAAESDATLQPEVAQNVAITENRMAKEAAVRLADEGRTDAAADLLHRQALANASLPAAAQSPAIDRENRVLEGTIQSLRANGSLSKSERKGIEYQNYQDRKQKR